MRMAKYGSVVYLYLTLCLWEISAVPFNPTSDNDALGQFGEEHELSRVTYGGPPIEGLLPFEQQKIASKVINGDQVRGSPMGYGSLDGSDLISQEKRAARNFLRFGRGSPKNFIRFGRAGDSSQLGGVAGLSGDELEENGIDKRGSARNFLRFGRGSSKNFIRFGRASDKLKDIYGSNFGRFSRSAGKQLEKCKECVGAEEAVGSAQNAKSSSANLDKPGIDKRSKRSIPAFYDDLLFMAPTPLSWIENLGRFEPNPSQATGGHGSPVTGNGQKRTFRRYGRDPLDLHFLRFGKRGLPSAAGADTLQEDGFSRESRLNKNFLRFG